jgi:hypothetical protein
VAAYTKSGGSWLTWLLIEELYKPNFFCDNVSKKLLDGYVYKTERVEPTCTIHIVRNPFDLICSAYNYFLLTERAVSKDFFKNFLSNKGISGLNPTPWKYFVNHYDKNCEHTITYEDLTENPVETLQNILPISEETLDKYSLEKLRDREAGVNSAVINRTTNKKYSFFNKASKYYYKDMLDKDLIDLGINTFEEELNRYWDKKWI